MASTDKEIKTSICRICLLGAQERYFSLFELFKDYSAAYHINALTNVHIIEGDKYPDRICSSCLLDLETAVNFKLKCESSDAQLRQTKTDTFGNKSKTTQSSAVLPDGECKVKQEINDNDDFDDIESSLNLEQMLELADNPIADDNIDHLGLVSCDECGEVLKTKFKLTIHWNKVHKRRFYDCDLCNARFRSMKPLVKHKHLRIEKCKILNSVKIDGFGKNRIFTCPTCKYTTKEDHYMLQHLTVHTGERNFKCTICNKSFRQSASLAVHKENVHKMFKRILTCHYCGLKFGGNTKFYAHMKTKHYFQLYECDICHKKLKSKRTLIDHLRRHDGIKNYSCEYCAKVVTTANELHNHKMYAHFNKDGKKLLDCPLCQYKSKNKKIMSAHQEKHTAENISCETCGKFYNTELKLWVHKICHLPKDSICRRTCPFCGRLFDNNGFLRKHMVCHLNRKVVDYDRDEVISKIKNVLAGINQSNHRKRKYRRNSADEESVSFKVEANKAATGSVPVFPQADRVH